MVAQAEINRSIVIVTEGGPHIWLLVNAIADRLGPVCVIVETPQSKWEILRRRARRQGWISVAGQLGTMVLVRLFKRLPAFHSAVQPAEGLETEPRTNQQIVRIDSADSAELVAALSQLEPGVVLLAGCRVLGRTTLASISCPILNYHAGIAPKYRGMNGGYWARASGDDANFGTTVHLVDAGIDTGAVLGQARGEVRPGDTIATDAMRQAAFSRELCVEALEDVLAGNVSTFDPGLQSRQWYHPTLWAYLWTGLTRGIW